jgi:ankyrin repeat protein
MIALRARPAVRRQSIAPAGERVLGEAAMRRVMLLIGMGTALIAAANACGSGPALPLALVAARNAVGTVRQLLAAGHPPDQPDGGLTPLMWAARNGALEAMAALIQAGADVNARDTRNGWTPLLHAVHTQQPAAIRLLLQQGADPNARTAAVTPLLMAAADPDPAPVALLLEYGADPSARGFGGSTALSQAVSGGALSDIDRPLLGGCRTETVRALLRHDPTLTIPDTIAGHHAIWWAKFHGCGEVLTLIRASEGSRG